MSEPLLPGAGASALGLSADRRASAAARLLPRPAKVQPAGKVLATAGGASASSSSSVSLPPDAKRRDIFGAWARRAQRAIVLFYAQAGCIVLYAVATFVLPQIGTFLSAAPHVASFHALLFVVLVALVVPTLRVTHGPEADWLPPFFPLSPLLAGGPLLVVTLGNAVLLPLNGMDSWLEPRADHGSFSVLVLVQVLACIEAAAAAGMAGRLLWRSAQFKRLQPGGIAGMQPAGRNRKLAGLLSFAKGGKEGSGLGLPGSSGPSSPAGPVAAGSAASAALPELPSLVSLSVAVPDAATLARMYTKLTAPPRDAAAPAGGEGGAAGGGEGEGEGGAETGASTSAAGPGAELTDAARGGVTPAGFAAVLPNLEDRTKVADRLAYLQRREADLTSRVDALTRLVDGSSPRGTATGELSALLRAHAEELIALQAMYKALVAFADAQDEKIRYYESELRRATVDTQQLRRTVREARAKNDKLVAAMQVERDANEVAQATILELRDRLGALVSAAGAGNVGGAAEGAWSVPGVSINAGGGGGHPHTPLGSAAAASSFHGHGLPVHASAVAASAAVGIAGAVGSGGPRSSFHSSSSGVGGGTGGVASASRPVSFASRASFAAVVGSPGTGGASGMPPPGASSSGAGMVLGSPTHASGRSSTGAAVASASPYLLARAPVPSVLPEAFSLTRASAATPTHGGSEPASTTPQQQQQQQHTTLAAALAAGGGGSSPQSSSGRAAST